MRYFELSDQIKSDACAIEARQRESQSVEEYLLRTQCYLPQQFKDDAVDAVNSNRRLIIKDGYGIPNADVIDTDSFIKYQSEFTNVKQKTQFNVRAFHACPDLSKGTLFANTESELLSGTSTLPQKHCGFKLAEVNYDRFVPMTECVRDFYKNESEVLPDMLSIGESSRDILLRQRRQLCGAKK
jgi:hypothetical protein